MSASHAGARLSSRRPRTSSATWTRLQVSDRPWPKRCRCRPGAKIVATAPSTSSPDSPMDPHVNGMDPGRPPRPRGHLGSCDAGGAKLRRAQYGLLSDLRLLIEAPPDAPARGFRTTTGPRTSMMSKRTSHRARSPTISVSGPPTGKRSPSRRTSPYRTARRSWCRSTTTTGTLPDRQETTASLPRHRLGPVPDVKGAPVRPTTVKGDLDSLASAPTDVLMLGLGEKKTAPPPRCTFRLLTPASCGRPLHRSAPAEVLRRAAKRILRHRTSRTRSSVCTPTKCGLDRRPVFRADSLHKRAPGGGGLAGRTRQAGRSLREAPQVRHGGR